MIIIEFSDIFYLVVDKDPFGFDMFALVECSKSSLTLVLPS